MIYNSIFLPGVLASCYTRYFHMRNPTEMTEVRHTHPRRVRLRKRIRISTSSITKAERANSTPALRGKSKETERYSWAVKHHQGKIINK